MDKENAYNRSENGEPFTIPTQNQLAKLFFHYPEAVIAANVDGNIIFAGGSVESMWGYSTEELIGNPFFKFIVEEDKIRTRNLIDKLLDSEPEFGFFNRISKKDGSELRMHWSVRRDKEENLYWAIGKMSSGIQGSDLMPEFKSKKIDELLNRVSDGFYATDKNWRITYINRHGCEILHCDYESIIGKVIWEVFPQAMNHILYEKYHQSLNEQIPLTFEMYYTPLQTWFEIKTHPSPEGLSVFFRDITDEKEAERIQGQYEKKIEYQSEFLTAILENMEQGYANLGLDGTVYYWNKEAERISGIPRELLLNKNLWKVYPKPIEPDYFIMFEQLKNSPRSIQHEYRAKDNRWLEFNVYPTRDGLSIFFRNITGRKQIEEETARLSRITQKTSNIIILLDTRLKIKWVNNAFIKITGYRFEEVKGKNPIVLLQGSEADPKLKDLLVSNSKKGTGFHHEMVSYTKEQVPFWVVAEYQPVLESNGNLKECFVVLTDITEIKKLQKKLDEEQKENQKRITAAVIEAQEAERALVSHELHDNVNQVLSTVKMYTEHCLEVFPDNRELLEKSVELLSQSIAEIRALSRRLSAPSLGGISLDESIGDLIDTVAATTRVEISLNIIGLERAKIDPDLHLSIYRILQEHLNNVMRHSRANKLTITIQRKNKNLQIEAVDDGVGFDDRKKVKGIGITNMITRTESMQGQFEIISAPGKGCTMRAIFPLNPTARQPRSFR